MDGLKRFLFWSLLIFGTLFLSYEWFLYQRALELFPPQTSIAGVNVGGMIDGDAAEAVASAYSQPVYVYHQEERIEIDPATVGFQLDIPAMLYEARQKMVREDVWLAFLEFVVGRSVSPITVDILATHDPAQLREQIETVASFADKPVVYPQLTSENGSLKEGQAGYITDIDASLPAVEQALYTLDGRSAELVIIPQEKPTFDMNILKRAIELKLEGFDGIASIFVMDLRTGEELSINADVAVSGLSIIKIPILMETYRAIDGQPYFDQQKLISETIVNSGNYSANLLLDVVAGQDNAYLGVDIMTESLHQLGLVNTFMVTPYEEPNRPGLVTMFTPANTEPVIDTTPDPATQTTAEDMGTLLSMIYHCAQGKGTLLLVYPDQITPEECQAMLDVMALNVEGNLIRFGVPNGVQVSHKHGWGGNTHGDAGIVFSPGGDYVIVEYLTMPYANWLEYDVSFPILREISRVVYNYFNFDNPYFGDALEEADRFDPSDPYFNQTDEDSNG